MWVDGSGWEGNFHPEMEVATLKATDGKGHDRPNDILDSNKIKQYTLQCAFSSVFEFAKIKEKLTWYLKGTGERKRKLRNGGEMDLWQLHSTTQYHPVAIHHPTTIVKRESRKTYLKRMFFAESSEEFEFTNICRRLIWWKLDFCIDCFYRQIWIYDWNYLWQHIFSVSLYLVHF